MQDQRELTLPIKFEPSHWENSWSYKKAGKNGIKGAILAAGLGRRMEPLSSTCLPKPLFPLGGKVPMAEVWVRRLVESGITDISMNVCVLADTVKNYFQQGEKLAANITYIDENFPSGTFGGVCKLALGKEAKRVSPEEDQASIEFFKGSTIISPSGDIVSNFGSEQLEEMYDIHKKAGAAFTIVLVPIPWDRRKDFGTAIFDRSENLSGLISKQGKIEGFIEKDPDSPSNLSNASIYMIEMELLKALDNIRTEARIDVHNPFYDFGKHVFPALLDELPGISMSKKYPLWGIQYEGKWFDIGQKRDYLTVNEHLLNNQLNITLPYENLPWGYLGTNVDIDFSKVTIIPPVVIGNNSIIEPGSTLGPYAVIGDGWRVQKEAHIQHSVLWGRDSYYNDKSQESFIEARKAVDKHEIRSGVSIEQSIIAGGDIKSDIIEKTVDIDGNGKMRILSIDYVPEGPRA